MTRFKGAFREIKLFNVEHYLENLNTGNLETWRNIFLLLRLGRTPTKAYKQKIQYISTIIHVRTSYLFIYLLLFTLARYSNNKEMKEIWLKSITVYIRRWFWRREIWRGRQTQYLRGSLWPGMGRFDKNPLSSPLSVFQGCTDGLVHSGTVPGISDRMPLHCPITLRSLHQNIHAKGIDSGPHPRILLLQFIYLYINKLVNELINLFTTIW